MNVRWKIPVIDDRRLLYINLASSLFGQAHHHTAVSHRLDLLSVHFRLTVLVHEANVCIALQMSEERTRRKKIRK